MDQPHRRSGLICALVACTCVLVGASSGAAVAQEAEPDTGAEEDPTVAVVDGTPIHRSDVTAYVATLPAQYQQAFDQIFPFLVQRLIDLALIDKAAAAEGLSEDEVVQQRLSRLQTEVMREVYMERLLADAVSEEDLEARYQAFLAENPPVEEVRARHILLETEDEARQVVEALDGGMDFAELASERSTGPSAAQGGDLGYFTAEQMVPSFSEAAFGLEPGSYTSEPVQSEFGWHVIFVEDKRPRDPPSLEEVAPQLTQELQGAAIESHITDLRADADIEIMESAQPPSEEPAMEAPAPEEGSEGEASESESESAQ